MDRLYKLPPNATASSTTDTVLVSEKELQATGDRPSSTAARQAENETEHMEEARSPQSPDLGDFNEVPT